MLGDGDTTEPKPTQPSEGEPVERTSVYQYFDARGVILYAGITAQGPGRQNQHNKTAEWWDFVASQAVEHYDTREVAQARETMLIRQHRPPFNRQQSPDYPRMRAAYLTLFGPRSVAALPAVHECMDCEHDEPACEWPKVPYAANGWCGDSSCDVCHAKFHGYSEGLPAGYDEGRKAAPREVVAERKPCGHCWACQKEREDDEEWDLDELCDVLNGVYPCEHCGAYGCMYQVGHSEGCMHGHEIGYQSGEGTGFDRATAIHHDDSAHGLAIAFVVDKSSRLQKFEPIDPFGGHRSVVELDQRICEVGTTEALKELFDASRPDPWATPAPSEVGA